MDAIAADLAAYLVDHLRTTTPTNHRLLVGIAGIPASGKSTLAALIVSHANKLLATPAPLPTDGDPAALERYASLLRVSAALIGLDGWHLSRAELDALPDPALAHERRGAHWTFDGAAYAACVRALRAPVAIPHATVRASWHADADTEAGLDDARSEASVPVHEHGDEHGHSPGGGDGDDETWSERDADESWEVAVEADDDDVFAVADSDEGVLAEDEYEELGAPSGTDASHLGSGRAAVITAPSFDHALKDPTPHAVAILPQHRIVVIEGLYTLLDLEPWRAAGELLDERWYLELEEAEARKRLVKRHVLTGVTEDLAEAYLRADNNDMPNGRFIIEHMLEPTRRIASVEDPVVALS